MSMFEGGVDLLFFSQWGCRDSDIGNVSLVMASTFRLDIIDCLLKCVTNRVSSAEEHKGIVIERYLVY